MSICFSLGPYCILPLGLSASSVKSQVYRGCRGAGGRLVDIVSFCEVEKAGLKRLGRLDFRWLAQSRNREHECQEPNRDDHQFPHDAILNRAYLAQGKDRAMS